MDSPVSEEDLVSSWGQKRADKLHDREQKGSIVGQEDSKRKILLALLGEEADQFLKAVRGSVSRQCLCCLSQEENCKFLQLEMSIKVMEF